MMHDMTVPEEISHMLQAVHPVTREIKSEDSLIEVKPSEGSGASFTFGGRELAIIA